MTIHDHNPEATPAPSTANHASDAGAHAAIRIRGARQNNLKNLDLDLPLQQMTVVTGVSGSGKSSLVFDTLYAEGQRRYVETFSAYARQFLDRMDRPQVDRIDGVPPAIAIDQSNPVRTSRSTVGTMTELTDHLKVLFARVGRLYCRQCAAPVVTQDLGLIAQTLQLAAVQHPERRYFLCFAVTHPADIPASDIATWMAAQGWTHGYDAPAALQAPHQVWVRQDRWSGQRFDLERVTEGLEAVARVAQGRITVFQQPADGETTTSELPVLRFQCASPHDTARVCPSCELSYPIPTPAHFSFNSAIGACETCRGFGRVIGVDLGLVIPDGKKSLRAGAIKPWQTQSFSECQQDLIRHATPAGIDLDTPWSQLSASTQHWVLHGAPDFRGAWEREWYGLYRFFEWLESRAYKMHVRVLLSRYRSYHPCPSCHGARLKPNSLLWRIGSPAADATVGAYQRFKPMEVSWSDATLAALPGATLHDVLQWPVHRSRRFFETLAQEVDAELAASPASAHLEATQLVLIELVSRLRYLCDVGLGYLNLDRQSRTLSGGEVQRINLTTALGTALTNTLFVLDEPSIGLHPRDLMRITQVMRRLVDAGNTLVVVEHDPLIMMAADRLVDIGPGPGRLGGEIVFQGSPSELRRHATSRTGAYLTGRLSLQRTHAARPVDAETPRLHIHGATLHNLRGLDLAIPLARLVAVAGVSGSGKSTLMTEVLAPALARALGLNQETSELACTLSGYTHLDGLAVVDQSPLGKTTRSNPAVYVGAFDAIRARFAATDLAQARAYTAGTFSFNAGDGRCPTCGGNGYEHVEMQFLSDVYLRCSDCQGQRYRPEILEVQLAAPDASRNPARVNIADVLGMTVQQACDWFGADSEIARCLQPLIDVGLDYVLLGQPVPTLSGGEAQRLKLAAFLAENLGKKKRKSKASLIIFDEPTTGLHFDDIAKLLQVLHRLVDHGHSVLVIEHQLDVIRNADWVLELGPDGGEHGGRLIAATTPGHLEAQATTPTGLALQHETALLARMATSGVESEAESGVLAEPAIRYGEIENEGKTSATPPSRQSQLRERARHHIVVHEAREHNLKNIDAEIPRQQLTVISGPSGSGKSTLAFDIIFAEGQRRYLESLNAYARQFVQPAARPDVEAVLGIPPTVAIAQRTSRGGRKSTVGTVTEIHHYLRLLFVKLGVQYCPSCQIPISPQSPEAIHATLAREHAGRALLLLAPLVTARKGLYQDLALWAAQRGFSHLRVDGVLVPTDPFPKLHRYQEHTLELPWVVDLRTAQPLEGAEQPEHRGEAALKRRLNLALQHGQGTVRALSLPPSMALAPDGTAALHAAADALKKHQEEAGTTTALYSTRRACTGCGTSFDALDPRLFSYNAKHGWCPSCFGTGLEGARSAGVNDENATEDLVLDELDEHAACSHCHGERLNPVARAVRFHNHSLSALSARPVSDLATWFAALELHDRELAIGRDVVAEIRNRLGFLREVGLGYLALDRAAPTLSGGESQRIRLAAQLGSNLQGVAYILDEPTIGLHPRDNRALLKLLMNLRDRGNTVLVVEHDEDTLRAADHVIDIGPGSGINGGRIVAQGTPTDIMAITASPTGRHLAAPQAIPPQVRRPIDDDTHWLRVLGAEQHNLQRLDVAIPLGRLVVLTGVSGSGKSSLARGVILDNLSRVFSGGKVASDPHWLGCRSIEGYETLDRVLEVDQTPIGKTPRSTPATYVGFWDAIRKRFATTEVARQRGWSASRFSFNSGKGENAGRCPVCEGAGEQLIEMNFLPDVRTSCEVCQGGRFNLATCQATWKGLSISDVLRLNVDQAAEFFAHDRQLAPALQLLQDVGLGYLTLGQPSPTLSGGEAQRIKLVTELSKAQLDLNTAPGNTAEGRRTRAGKRTLYVLDEPSVGLHAQDVQKLLAVLHRLTDAGHTVLVVEHDLDIWAHADWIIDLGPEGGRDGGQIVAQGTPQALAQLASTNPSASWTSRVLAERWSPTAGAKAQAHAESLR